MEMRIAGVTDFSIISLNDLLDSEEFCSHFVTHLHLLKEID